MKQAHGPSRSKSGPVYTKTAFVYTEPVLGTKPTCMLSGEVCTSGTTSNNLGHKPGQSYQTQRWRRRQSAKSPAKSTATHCCAPVFVALCSRLDAGVLCCHFPTPSFHVRSCERAATPVNTARSMYSSSFAFGEVNPQRHTRSGIRTAAFSVVSLLTWIFF